MKRLLTILSLIIFSTLAVKAQGDLDEQQKLFYHNERTFSLSLNSNGFGAGYREGKRLDYLNKRIAEIELSVLKHPKEIKLSNPYVQAGNSFVFGKLNSTYAFRAGIGHQHEIFKKEDLGGIAIRYFFTGGPSLVMSKPIYYNVLYPVGGTSYEIKQEKFNIDIHQPTDIYSKAGFFQGLNESSFIPGLYARGGFNFEYSKEDRVIHAIELGAYFEGYPKRVPIMASDDNRALFLTLFVTYRLGVVVDPFEPGTKKFQSIFFRGQK